MKTNIDLQQLVECVGDAIIVSDANENIVLWNPSATRIFGYTEDEVLGQSLDLIVPERQRQRHRDRKSTRLNSGHSQQSRMPSSA